MQKLTDLLKASPLDSELEKWNFCREYLQVVVLRSIFNSPLGPALAFQGGTCLRICHHLKRYSEDLDFSLEDRTIRYSFKTLHATVLKDLSRRGFEVGGACAEDKIVQKAFGRVGGLPRQVGFSMPLNQKL